MSENSHGFPTDLEAIGNRMACSKWTIDFFAAGRERKEAVLRKLEAEVERLSLGNTDRDFCIEQMRFGLERILNSEPDDSATIARATLATLEVILDNIRPKH